jgi:hypothetical protein
MREISYSFFSIKKKDSCAHHQPASLDPKAFEQVTRKSANLFWRGSRSIVG